MKLFIYSFLTLFIMAGCESNPENEPAKDTLSTTSDASGTKIQMRGERIFTVGQLPSLGTSAPNFKLVANDMSEKSLSDFKGKNVILNIFPSLDTKTCSASVRAFNEKASDLENTVVLGISKDLPFASDRFCTTEGIENVITLSDFRGEFGHSYGVQIADGPMKGLLSRAVVVINPDGEIVYEEQVRELTHEPDYEKAIAAVKTPS